MLIPSLPRFTTIPHFTILMLACREVIAATASQSPGTPLTDAEMDKTPEKYPIDKLQWMQKFKGTVIPHLHSHPRYKQYFKRVPYSDTYAGKSHTMSFNDIAVDITTKIYVSLGPKDEEVTAWLK